MSWYFILYHVLIKYLVALKTFVYRHLNNVLIKQFVDIENFPCLSFDHIMRKTEFCLNAKTKVQISWLVSDLVRYPAY